MPDPFWILLRGDDRDPEQLGRLNQHRNSPAQPRINLWRHRRHQALLDIDHHQNRLVRIQLEFLHISRHMISFIFYLSFFTFHES